MKEFLLSDETVNSYGFKVLTSGIDVSRFEKNPVMFYNHDREKGVIGRWGELRKTENELFGVPVFDEKDELGSKIAGKVKDGFIKAASIGISDMVIDGDADTPVMVSCVLTEVSVCDIPSNENALVVYVDDKPVTSKSEILKLYKSQKMNSMNHKEFFKQACDALGLDPETKPETVLEKIKKLTESSDEMKIKEAADLGLLEAGEFKLYLNQLKTGNKDVLNIVSEKLRSYQLKQKERIVSLYNENKEKILTTFAVQGWDEVKKLGYESVKKIVDELPERRYLSKMVQGVESGEHDLNWYRKNNPKALIANPELYQTLLNERKNK